MNRLAGETACPTHRGVLAAMWGRQCCLPSAVLHQFFHTFSGPSAVFLDLNDEQDLLRTDYFEVEVTYRTAIPEPATILLVGTAAITLFRKRWGR